jgi:signal transduction histidine kinase
MKEPIRKAKLFTDRLRAEYGSFLPEKGLSYLERIQKATDRLTNMVEGVLNYSTINTSAQNIEAIHLDEIIKSIETDLELQIHAKKATISYSNLPAFEGAQFLIYQLFYNLVNNAIKFADETRSPTVVISGKEVQGKELLHLFPAKPDEIYVEINVADNGIGFDSAKAELIFSTFTRLHPRDQYEGTGMGLALVKRIVGRHQGFVYASSSKGEGASFTVLLPKTLQKLS